MDPTPNWKLSLTLSPITQPLSLRPRPLAEDVVTEFLQRKEVSVDGLTVLPVGVKNNPSHLTPSLYLSSGNPTQTDTWLGCIDTQAFAAPLEGKNIKKSDSKRIGVLLINKCDDAIDVKVADKETNKMATYNAKPGVHTLVWA